jgi:outer membrane protein OmpA-like peptidoglycan-associated protein
MNTLRKVRPIGIALALIASIGIMTQQVRADGTTWTSRTATEANNWNSIAYGSETFVAVASNGTNRVMTSTDGITWTARTAAEANTWTAIAYGNETFVAVASTGTNQVMTSTDGITWTSRPIPSNSSQWSSVTWGNNRFVAVSRTGGSTDRVMTSTDGTTWTLANSIHNGNWNSVTFGNGTFVAVANNQGINANQVISNRVMTSTDGTTWTARTEAAQSGWTSVTYGGSKFVAVANSGTDRVMTSTDGTTWTAQSASDASAWSSVAYGDGIYVAVASFGSGARVMTSGTFVAPTTTSPTTTTIAPSAIPGVTVTDTKVYSRPPARVAAESSINVLTRAQNRTSDIATRTPSVCLPNDDELVFIDTGRCIADVVNTKTRRVLRTLRTTVIESDVSELNVGNEIVILAPIYFENGSSTLNAKAKRTLKNLTEQISAAGSVLVVGHSGTRNGNSPENIALSQARAKSTVAELRTMKATGPFSVSGVGALDPARSARTEKAQAKNRRVVVVLIP